MVILVSNYFERSNIQNISEARNNQGRSSFFFCKQELHPPWQSFPLLPAVGFRKSLTTWKRVYVTAAMKMIKVMISWNISLSKK
jgi:hypothetical protein